MDRTRGVRKSERISKTWGVTILNGKNNFIDFPSVSQIWSCLEIIVHRAISSSLDVIALFGIDQEQHDKLVQPCIAAIRYAEAAWSSGTIEFIHISSSVRVHRRQDLLSIVLSIVVCFPGPDVIKKILCWARLLAVGNMGCRNNGLSE